MPKSKNENELKNYSILIVDNRNRITIPLKARKKMNIGSGSSLLFTINSDGSATITNFSLNICPNCNKTMPDTSNYCDNCGTKLKKQKGAS